MQKRCGVHELHGGGETHVAIAFVAEHAGGCERHHGTQALAAGGNQMIGNFRYHFDIGPGAGKDHLVHPRHIGFRQIDERLNRSFLFLFTVQIQNQTQCHFS